MNNASQELLRLATERFGGLTVAECKMLEAVATDAMADYRRANDDSPANADTWGPERIIRAGMLRWVCTHRDVAERIDLKLLVVMGAKIQGELNFADMTVNCRLGLSRCSIRDGMNLYDAQLRTLDLSGSHCGPINASGVEISGSIFLRNGFQAAGCVTLDNASIKGNLECGGGRFAAAGGAALNCDRASISGSVFLNEGFVTQGEVRLLGATINGSLNCRGGRFENAGGAALVGDRASISGSVTLDKGFVAQGIVRLLDVTIAGSVECSGGYFGNVGGHALSCDRASIGGMFLTNGFVAQGEVRLLGATITGDLTCRGGHFENVGGVALGGDGASISGAVFLDNGFVAQGEVRLLGAAINGNLDCSGGRFENVSGAALIAQSAVVQGNVFFGNAESKPFSAAGSVSLRGTDIRRSLFFEGAVFNGGGEEGLDATNATISGTFRWKDVELGSNTILNLSHARVGQLDDSEGSWPKAGNLLLDGFVYEGIVGVPLNAQKRKTWVTDRFDWLGRQHDDAFSLQPYEQLSSILRRAGHEADAKHVLYRKQELLRRRSELNIVEQCWRWLLKWSIGYGYYAYWTFGWALVLIVLGTIFFEYGYQHGMLLSTEDVPRPFYAPVYSLDTLLPIIDFHQEEGWVPKANRLIDYWFPVYFWFHIAMGWLLTTLGVLGFTGLVRNE